MVRTNPGAKMDSCDRDQDPKAKAELRSACEYKADSIQRVVELLGNGSITAADATACL